MFIKVFQSNKENEILNSIELRPDVCKLHVLKAIVGRLFLFNLKHVYFYFERILISGKNYIRHQSIIFSVDFDLFFCSNGKNKFIYTLNLLKIKLKILRLYCLNF